MYNQSEGGGGRGGSDTHILVDYPNNDKNMHVCSLAGWSVCI